MAKSEKEVVVLERNPEKTFTGEKIRTIRLQDSNLPYVNTTEGSKNHGKQYNVYIFDGKAFTVRTDHPFAMAKASGKAIHSITCEVDPESGQLGFVDFETVATYSEYRGYELKDKAMSAAAAAGNLSAFVGL